MIDRPTAAIVDEVLATINRHRLLSEVTARKHLYRTKHRHDVCTKCKEYALLDARANILNRILNSNRLLELTLTGIDMEDYRTALLKLTR